ncbi:hypothetical protein RIF29_20269 [Crotalaria pallida]|uniref:Transmembrane protein n=1 Tax=Crotalaria pallida TaxID=3830 RepID=A0AAN9F282_CROPI
MHKTNKHDGEPRVLSKSQRSSQTLYPSLSTLLLISSTSSTARLPTWKYLLHTWHFRNIPPLHLFHVTTLDSPLFSSLLNISINVVVISLLSLSFTIHSFFRLVVKLLSQAHNFFLFFLKKN